MASTVMTTSLVEKSRGKEEMISLEGTYRRGMVLLTLIYKRSRLRKTVSAIVGKEVSIARK